MYGPTLYGTHGPIRNAETILTFRKLHKPHLFDLAFHPSSSAAWFPVDEPALASIMTHAHAKDLCACASELGPHRYIMRFD